jgi:hypothetical protein
MNNENYIKSLQNKAEDEYIGDLIFNQTQQQFVFTLRSNYASVFIPPLELPADKPKIAIILESPHKEEFGIQNLQNQQGEIVTARPLNNTHTRNHLITIMNQPFSNYFKDSLNKEISYAIILVNSIQYQTSLGLNDKAIRDQVWLWHWMKNGEQHFIDRIKHYKPILFINMCTKGKSTQLDAVNWSYVTKADLLNYDLDFNTTTGFSVKGYKTQQQFTLQDVVEFSLETNQLITNLNYKTFNHPSYYAFKNTTNYKSLNRYNGISESSLILKINTL